MVLEAMRYDPATGEVTVSVCFGRGSDWDRNVHASGPAWVDFGRGAREVEWRELRIGEAMAVMADYERRAGLFRPVVRRVLGALAGFDYRGTDDRRRLGRDLADARVHPTARGGMSRGAERARVNRLGDALDRSSWQS